MNRRSARHKGVYQRCGGDCLADRCARHTWTYSIELPTRDGRRIQASKGGYRSAKAAAEARADVLAGHRDGKVADDGRLTVGAWLDRWLTARENDQDMPLRPTTAHHYRAHVDLYLRPRLGHLRLRDLRREHVSRMLAEIVSDRASEIERAQARNAAWSARNPSSDVHPVVVPKPLSRATLARIRATLSSALGDAVDAGRLASNPATSVRLRKGKRRTVEQAPPVRAWSAAEVADFLDRLAAEDHPLTELYWLAAVHGLRRSELCGLRWPAVDLDAGALRVEHTRTSVGGREVEGTGKSEHSRAAVDLDPASVAMLRALRTRQSGQRLRLGAAWRGGEYVFVRADGVLWRPDYVSRGFDRLVGVYGLPRITLHGLRHTSASVQLAEGVPVEIVSKRLRHAHVGITSGVYSHLLRDAGQQAASAVADAVARHRKSG